MATTHTHHDFFLHGGFFCHSGKKKKKCDLWKVIKRVADDWQAESSWKCETHVKQAIIGSQNMIISDRHKHFGSWRFSEMKGKTKRKSEASEEVQHITQLPKNTTKGEGEREKTKIDP